MGVAETSKTWNRGDKRNKFVAREEGKMTMMVDKKEGERTVEKDRRVGRREKSWAISFSFSPSKFQLWKSLILSISKPVNQTKEWILLQLIPILDSQCPGGKNPKFKSN